MSMLTKPGDRLPSSTAKAVPGGLASGFAGALTRPVVLRLLTAAIVVGAWQGIGSAVSPLFMSYPSAVVKAAGDELRSGELLRALGQSLEALVIGFVIAVVAGIVIGLMLGRYTKLRQSVDWLVNALYATPLVAVVPLIIVWLGLGLSAKLFVVVALAIFPVLINTAAGAQAVPSESLDLGAAFCGNERQIFWKIIIPSAIPFVMTGVRLAIGRALIGVVIAEFFTGITGLGAMIQKYGNSIDTAHMLVPVLTLMLLGVLLSALARLAERKMTPWKKE